MTQITATDAPDFSYSVAKPNLEQQLALSQEQIEASNESGLFTVLPPQQGPLIPLVTIPGIWG